MTIYVGRRTQWRSLASASATAMAAAVAIAVPLMGASGGTVPMPSSTAAVIVGVGDTALSRDGSSAEARPVRATQPSERDQPSGRPAFMLYMLMEAARGSPLFSH